LILYRFARPDDATRKLAFAGEGGLKYAGRWNSAGGLIVYTSTTLSLAVLEILVHTRRPMPNSWPLFVADVPDRSIEKLSPVPQNWDAHPPSASSREAGDKWLQSKVSVGLLVPSVIIPQESNCLLNPAHPDFSLDWVEGPLDFPLDPRLQKFSSRRR
jgi:RES domain-containing protein